MFSFTGKKKVPVIRDCIWISKEGRNLAIRNWLADDSHIASAWFNDEVQDLRKLMPEYASRIILSSDLAFHSVEPGNLIFAGLHPLITVPVVLAENLGFDSITNYASLDTPFMRLFGGEKIVALMKQL